MDDAEVRPQYHIDLKCYEEGKMSFLALVRSRMCSSCQKKIEEWELRDLQRGIAEGDTVVKSEDASGFEPFAIIKDCCSLSPDFITQQLPLMEAIFRVFLAKGNQPLEVEQLRQELEERLTPTGDRRDISPRTLSALLENDYYYGLRPIPIPPPS